ncbi:hypothetical protein B0H14DRAFT_3518352 [Mycena olivaceomarginata]|nr:hypothetical protein B0H14DRAFT_3518352 [Mycena olivaceomarginata]
MNTILAILSGTVAIVVQLLALQGLDNLKELVIFSDEQETQPIYPPSEPMEALLSMVVKLTRLRCLALVIRARALLASNAAVFAPTVSFDVSGSKPLIGFFRLSSPSHDSALTTVLV